MCRKCGVYWQLTLTVMRRHDELLFDLVNMWVTMRGFALVSMWMEGYKRAKDKTVDKSKALRKELELEASEA